MPEKVVTDDTLSVVDLKSMPPRVIDTLHVGKGAAGVSVNAAGTVSVLSINGAKVAVVDKVDFHARHRCCQHGDADQPRRSPCRSQQSAVMATFIRKKDRATTNLSANQIALAYTYSLSKRTALYAAASTLTNNRFTGSKFGPGDTEYDAGIKLTF
jgi:hypothetical protein